MPKFNRSLRLFFCCLLGWTVLAKAQVLPLSENATAKVNIASHEPTRIAVENDRIAILRGMEGAYTYSNDNTRGAVFLKPTEAYQNTPFYVFISTEQGHNYVLQLKPVATLSAGLLTLKPRHQALAAAQQWESTSPYTDTLAQLMTDMVNHRTPDGYEVIPINAKKGFSVGTHMRLRLKTVYTGAHLQGKIYELTNSSTTSVTLTERIFYRPGDRALALREEIIPAGGKTLLYKVNSHG